MHLLASENPVNAMKEGTLNLGREVSFFVATIAVSSISMTVHVYVWVKAIKSKSGPVFQAKPLKPCGLKCCT